MATRTGTRPPHPLHPSPCPYSQGSGRCPLLPVLIGNLHYRPSGDPPQTHTNLSNFIIGPIATGSCPGQRPNGPGFIRPAGRFVAPKADKSAMGTVNRPLHARLSTSISYTSYYSTCIIGNVFSSAAILCNCSSRKAWNSNARSAICSLSTMVMGGLKSAMRTFFTTIRFR